MIVKNTQNSGKNLGIQINKDRSVTNRKILV